MFAYLQIYYMVTARPNLLGAIDNAVLKIFSPINIYPRQETNKTYMLTFLLLIATVRIKSRILFAQGKKSTEICRDTTWFSLLYMKLFFVRNMLLIYIPETLSQTLPKLLSFRLIHY